MNDDLPTLQEALDATMQLLSAAEKEAGARLGIHPETASGYATAQLHVMAENDEHFAMWLRRTWAELLPLLERLRTCEPWQQEQFEREVVEKRESFFQSMLDLFAGTLYLCEGCSSPVHEVFLVCQCLLQRPGKAVALLPSAECTGGFIWCWERYKTGHKEDELRTTCRACADSKGLLAHAIIVDPAKLRSKRTKPRLR